MYLSGVIKKHTTMELFLINAQLFSGEQTDKAIHCLIWQEKYYLNDIITGKRIKEIYFDEYVQKYQCCHPAEKENVNSKLFWMPKKCIWNFKHPIMVVTQWTINNIILPKLDFTPRITPVKKGIFIPKKTTRF